MAAGGRLTAPAMRRIIPSNLRKRLLGERVVFEDDPEVTALPDGLDVEVLIIRDCPNLLELPRGLHVRALLHLQDVPIVELPEDLRVGGSLAIAGCEDLKRLPEHLDVPGSLSLSGIQSMMSMHTDMTVGSDLSIRHCRFLGSIDAALMIGRKMEICNCHRLDAIGTAVIAGHDVSVNQCRSFRGFFGTIRSGATLSVSECPRFHSFPADLEVGKSLVVRNCGSQWGSLCLPEGLRLQKNLDLSGSGIRELPGMLDVGQGLGIRNTRIRTIPRSCGFQQLAAQFSDLESLPAGRLRYDSINIAGCKNFKSLPEGLDMRGDLVATDSSLEAMGSDIRVAGRLDVEGCVNLRCLPRGLIVSELVWQRGSGIERLPADLRVRRLHLEQRIERPDGFTCDAIIWRGVRVEPRIVFAPDTITVTEILSESNVEVRRVLLEFFGFARFIRETEAEILDQVAMDDSSEIVGLRGSQLLLKELDGDEPLVMLVLRNSSPEPDGSFKEVLLRVPPDMRSCREGVAWTFDLDPLGYAPHVET